MSEVVFEDAPDVENIARRLIPEHHTHLADAKIKYLGREGAWSVGGKIRWGSAEKCSAKHRHLTGYDFIIIINVDVWGGLESKQKVALVDHELSHCGINDNGWCIWPHDVEDFASVVRRHGLWQEGVRKYAEAAVEASRQLTIFDIEKAS
jgi:hypothetical protein